MHITLQYENFGVIASYRILLDGITYPCLKYPLLAPSSTYVEQVQCQFTWWSTYVVDKTDTLMGKLYALTGRVKMVDIILCITHFGMLMNT